MKKLYTFISAALLIASIATGSATIATATPKSDHKVTICHATNAVKNPYVKITIDTSAADGVSGEKNTTHGDHFNEHTGPIATSQSVAQDLKDDGKKWGDIIPPVGNHAGLNWTAEGKAIYNNDCKYAKSGEVLSETTSASTSLTTPETLPETGSELTAIIFATILAIATYIGFSSPVVRSVLARLV